MKLSGLTARTRRSVRAVALSIVGALAVTGAVVYPGVRTADVDLNDGGVWVTNTTLGLVGHLNYPSRTLDGGFVANSNSFDVHQRAATVFSENRDVGALNRVDTASMTTGEEQALPEYEDVQLGSRYALTVQPADGTVWVGETAALASLTTEDATPLVEGAPGTVAAIGPDDTVAVADPQAHTVTTFVLEDGEYAEPETATVPEITGDLQITLVGRTAVVLTGTGGLITGGDVQQLPDATDAVLQLSSADAGRVAVATASSLLEVPLDGGEPTGTATTTPGRPIAPVQLNGCVHAAWTGSAEYLRQCANDADDDASAIPSLGARSELVFRTNRDVVILNDLAGGNVWLVQQDMVLVDNWDEIIPPPEESDEEDQESADENPLNTLPDRTGENRPPVAEDDAFGVRPGRTTLLPVLDNDSDPDGDILTVTLQGDDPPVGTVQPVYDSTGLQIVVPADAAPGRHSFQYRIDDGRGGTDTAAVQLDVRSDTANGAPSPKRATRLTLEHGATITANILSDWEDPDGDDLFLRSATIGTEGDQVRTRDDGQLTYRDAGGTLGPKEITVQVSDGQDTAEGTVLLDVQPTGNVPPQANSDHITVAAGQDVVVAPLKNDLDPSGRGLRLTQVTPPETATVTPDYELGTFTFSSAVPGTVYVTYVVANGPATAEALVRVDVTPEGGAPGDPIAVRDVALLPTGGQTLVDALANDTDPGGGVLVLQSVELPPNSELNVAVLEHNILRVTDARGLRNPTTFTYTVSNGTSSATGQVSVLPLPAPERLEPPRATADDVTVRAGDVATVNVLENDVHPDNADLALAPELVEPPSEGSGLIAVAGDAIRFKAGTAAGTFHAVYAVLGPDGQSDSAQVTFRVKPATAENNARPAPKALEARAIAGNPTRIVIPLDGIDPDGDSVSLVGIEQAPTKGTAVVGATFIEYTAAGDVAGQDVFSYVVEDRYGARSTATVLVGIAPPSAANQPPVAVDDSIAVQPDRRVSVDVLKNDSDPDGDPLSVTLEGLDLPAVLQAEIIDRKLFFDAPSEPITTAVPYLVSDGRGGDVVGTVRIEVSPTARRLAPVAFDDRVSFADTRGRTAVDVPVLDNDVDPDGAFDELAITFPENTEGVSAADGLVTVTLQQDAQLVPYQVTDPDGLSSVAFIRVPGLRDQRPALRDTEPLEVQTGEELLLDLTDLVVVREGRTPVITEDSGVSAVASDGGALVRDVSTLAFTSAQDYSGAASVTFEVTDGTSADDPDGLTSVLTVGVRVLPDPDRNTPPTLTSGGVEVEQEGSGTLDLAGLAADEDPQDSDRLTFSLVGDTPAGLSARLDGSVLEVGSADAPAGTRAALRVAVTDPRGGRAEAIVDAVVVSSRRPLAVANDDVLGDAAQGETVTVPVLANDTNPFPETPLQLLDAEVETGTGSASVVGSEVSVTPGEDFVGTLVVRYRVADSTRAADRQVDGRIRLTVRGRPETPSAPFVVEVRNRTAVLEWDPPAANGAPITGYTVQGTGGFSQACPSTTCTLTPLTNNVEYTFTVTATNEVGESDPSAASPVARPDEKPSTPEAPALTFGDGSLAVQWSVPPTEGSPVESYDLEISPAPPGGGALKAGVQGTSLEWSGLANGTPYQVRVRAYNRAPDPSEYSAYSAPEIPAGAPATPAAPVSALGSRGGEANSVMNVSWTAPAGNGAEIQGYTLTTLQNGQAVTSTELSGSQTSSPVTVANSEAPYSFTVTATNKAGVSGTSPASAPRQASGAPGAVPGVSAKEGDRSITVAYGEAARNGATPGQLRYEYSLGGGWRAVPGDRVIRDGIANGTTYRVTLRAVNTADGQVLPGPEAQSDAVVPYGAPNAPGVQAQANGMSVRFTVTAPSSNGREITGFDYTTSDGQAGSLGPAGGSIDKGDSANTSWSIRVTTRDSAGQRSGEATAQAGTAPTTMDIGKGPRNPSITSEDTYWEMFRVNNFPAGPHRVSCYADQTNGGTRAYASGIDDFPVSGTFQSRICYGKFEPDSTTPGYLKVVVDGVGEFSADGGWDF
ncbi:Ig-like domain-containing protein [Arthrobacter agilis]|uniref:Ig-like domain-containing protein n=1 Tax=Arthrobacter agilis TaxID=37921 RepID=UPI0027D882D2|nr:Ig-like domain-containing protein [Arthrobacter agilis]